MPTVADRVCQTVAKLMFEPMVEPYFHEDSYGYRPHKSALDAVGVTRKRCWQWDWVLEFDIKGLFDNISHELLMKAVRKHTNEKWLILYMERWLKAPMVLTDFTVKDRTCGTPQGGVISPVLSNLFLHYTFDMFMTRAYPELKWCRYADDGLVHCRTLEEAQNLLAVLKKRFAECGLELHPEKTRIVYCKDDKREGTYSTQCFDFLGYTFRLRVCHNKVQGKNFLGFTPSASRIALKSMRRRIRQLNIRNRTELSLEDIARLLNPILRGWLNYYGKYTRSGLYPVWRHFNKTLISWIQRKYRRFYRHKTRASMFLERIRKEQPSLFVHWKAGMIGAFA